MANTQLESQVINHLEFLGYEVNPVPDIGTGEMKMLRAERSSGGSINIMLFERAVNFSIWFSLNDFAMANKQGLLEVVNDLNRRFETKYYIDKMGETPAFFYGLVYLGPYDKKAFGQFVSTWEREKQALWGTEITKFLA
jgi:hypothetical protein